MLTQTVRSLWAEPRVPDAPAPAARDWALVAVAVAAGIIETAARPDLVWRPLALAVLVLAALTLPWRRTHPLPVAVVAFGAVTVMGIVALVRGREWEELGSGAFFLLILYALSRWGSGREVAAGMALVAVPLTLTALRGAPVGDIVGGVLIVLLALAVGAGARYQKASRRQEIDSIRSKEREELARELHDTVAHHVSAIAIQAQAGRMVATSRPGAAEEALAVIEEEASRVLEEMRFMVGTLRHGGQAELAPQQRVDDIARLARSAGREPRIDVELTGDLAGLRPSVEAALYRLAQEAITNALRHARHATLVRVRICGDGELVRLSVVDDGDHIAGPGAQPGFGLVGMAERSKLLGGVFSAGPGPDRGWTVTAELPRHGDAT